MHLVLFKFGQRSQGWIQDFGKGGPKLRAKPESRARSARELRAKLDPRAKPENKRGRGLGRGSVSSPENF